MPPVFDAPSARDYLEGYSTPKNIGYAVSERAILDVLVPDMIERQKLRLKSKILGVGSGPGLSDYRMYQAIKGAGINGFSFITTEIDKVNINTGKASLQKKEEPKTKLIVPQVQMAAEMISFKNNIFNYVIGSQLIHWASNLPMFFNRAFQVLERRGLFIQAGSGIIKNMDEKLHFTDHEAYQYFQNCVKELLIQRGYWNDASGEFSSRNPKVNGKFHRYEVDEVMNLLKSTGFTEIEKSIHDVPVTSDQMKARMELGAVKMFLFQGAYADQIPKEDIKEIVDKARAITMEDKPDLFADLDTKPAFDSVILFVGKKPEV